MLQLVLFGTFVTLIGCDLEKQPRDLFFLEECQGTALGMEHGHIKDADITASSTFDYHSVGPHIGRARQDVKGGAWCPALQISSGVREWLEINLHSDFRITAAETMGRYGGGQGQEFAQSYQLEYWRAGTWHLYTNTSGHQMMAGNVNTYMANKQELVPAIVASRVRFLPHSHHPRTVCMRVELFGCRYTSPVLSYSVAQGDQFSPRVYLEDVYDGQEDGGLLSGGLGLLSDGRMGGPLTFRGGGGLVSAPGWVGWTNKKFPLEMVFVFSSFQSLESVGVATYNKPDMGIAGPSKLTIKYKNVRGNTIHNEDIEVTQTTSLDDGTSLIKYNLGNCLAKEISLFLHFGAKWIILSEVHFSSETVDAHYIENTLDEQPTEQVNQTTDDSVRMEIDKKDRGRKNELEKEKKDEEIDESRGEKETEEPNSVIPIANGDSSQMYIGITIGILSMSVLLLLFTIFFMLRKNKHRIFSKHSGILGGSKGQDKTATDIRLRLSPLIYSTAAVNTRRRISEYRDDDSDLELDKQTIYDEPHRPLHTNILKSKNKSCDILCQYENFCDQGLVNMNNFGSTPLFNIFTVDQPGSSRVPPPTSYSTTNFKDRQYPAYAAYSTPLRAETLHPRIAASESDVSDNFYAASDILNLKPETSNSLSWRSFIPSSVSKNDPPLSHY